MGFPANYSKACIELPPLEADYTAKGKLIDVAGIKTYHVGNTSAKTAIIVIYDIHGFNSAQIHQGADILANATGGPEPFQVFMPDLMEGKTAKREWWGNISEEMAKEKAAFFKPGGGANHQECADKLGRIVAELKEKHKEIENFGVVGFCWGAKVVCLVSKQGTPFFAGAGCHPSYGDAADAKDIVIPTCVLASKNENADLIKEFSANLTVPKFVDTYADMPHGWMASRGDVVNEPGKSEFIRGYTTVLNFFHEHLSDSTQKL